MCVNDLMWGVKMKVRIKEVDWEVWEVMSEKVWEVKSEKVWEVKSEKVWEVKSEKVWEVKSDKVWEKVWEEKSEKEIAYMCLIWRSPKLQSHLHIVVHYYIHN